MLEHTYTLMGCRLVMMACRENPGANRLWRDKLPIIENALILTASQ